MPTLPPSSVSTPGTERLTVRVSMGVQSKEGMNFGKLVWLEGTRLYVQVDATFLPLDLVTMRADLSPSPGTALMEGEVMRVLPGTPSEPQGYLIRLKKVHEGDEARWQQFLRLKQSGGTLRELSDVRDSTGALASTYSDITERERQAARDRMRGAGTSTWSSSQLVEGGGGRAAMRDALRAAMKGEPAPNLGPAAAGGPVPTVRSVGSGSHGGAAPSARSFPPSLASVSATRSVAPPGVPGVQSPRTIAPGVPVAGEDPGWILSAIAGRSYLQVTWKGAEVFTHDANTQLVSGLLTLNSDGRALPSAPPIHVVLRYESLIVQCTGTVIRAMPLLATYRLDLSAAQIVDIRRTAKPPSAGSPR